MDKPKRRCVECKKTNFYNVNGQYVCVECDTYATDQVEIVCDEFEGQTQGRKYKSLGEKKDRKNLEEEERNKRIQDWNIYDGFNFILVKMTDALIKCGADPNIKPCVHRLWASYLSKMEVAYREASPPTSPLPDEFRTRETEMEEVEEQPSIVPSWFSQNNELDSQAESDDQPLKIKPKRTTLFSAPKVAKRKYYKKGLGEMDILLETADAELSLAERRKKGRKLRSNYMKLALSGADTDVSMAESIGSSAETQSTAEDGQKRSRLSTMKYAVPECFPEGELVSILKRKNKTEDYTAPRSTCSDPEYMTVHKLLSFLHAALLLKGQLITYGDLTRWTREGFIPLYGAHLLLPKSMPISGSEAHTLGALRTNGSPCSRIFRQNTGRLLTMLNIGEIPKPPAFLLASKIICDLQLPNELEVYVRTLDRIINQDDNDAEWKTVLFGNRIPSDAAYAGSLILVAMKLVFGLDGMTEFQISDFATKVNNLLKLKPSSSFASKQQGVENENNQETSQGIKTLFVWKEWVRFIEYRRNVIDRTHVPTAIRKAIVKKMDPAYVYQFAQTEGFYHYNRPTTELSEIDRSILEVFEKAAKRFPSPLGPPKRIPRFRSSLFGLQGLADQLLEFDPSEYGQLKQEFSTSSLVFSRKPKLLAAALKKANPPHLLKIHKGPALKDRKFVMPLITSRCGISKASSQMDRYAWKIVTVDSEVLPVSNSSDDDEELDEFYDSQSRPSLLLHDPSYGYWISALRLKLVAFVDWNLFSASLPSSFLWLLQLICESIEESPRDFYPTFNAVEAIVFLGHTDVKRNITGKKELKQRLYNALRAEF